MSQDYVSGSMGSGGYQVWPLSQAEEVAADVVRLISQGLRVAQGFLLEGRGRCSFRESKGSVVGADLEMLQCGGLDDSPARLTGASFLGFPLQEISDTLDTSPTLSFWVRRLRPETIPKVIAVI